MIVDALTFCSLPTEQIARQVRESGTKVCVFPINGTRRWFMLEHPPQPGTDPVTAYLDITQTQHIALYRLIFDHGIHTLLAPMFGPDLLERGDDYMRMAADGMVRLASHPEFMAFYQEHGVRVRFYGDHRRFLGPTPYAHLSDLFDAATEQTRHNDRYRLFYGVFANDATETIASLGVRHFQEHGQLPDKAKLVEMYYGEPVPPVDLFLGFDKFCSFDMPLLATGNEDLYFTVSPSLYLTEPQLRAILYDHLYARRDSDPDYATMSADDRALMGAFYKANQGKTLGVGAKHPSGGYWYPLSQVVLPNGFAKEIPAQETTASLISTPEPDTATGTTRKACSKDLDHCIQDVLEQVGPNRSQMSNTVYDTAWIARLMEVDESMGRSALDWLEARQLPDGGWGSAMPHYHHDRMICTLSTMIVLARYDRLQQSSRWEQAQEALETAMKNLHKDPMGGTIGFEMITPTLYDEAQSLGVINHRGNGVLTSLSRHRAAKLAKLHGGMINRHVTLAFSAEMAGPDGQHLLDAENLQEVNGSVGHSPSATAYFASYVRPRDPAAMRYLQSACVGGAVPTVAPSDVFELGWVLWNTALTMPLSEHINKLCQPYLDFLKSVWEPGKGIAQASGYTPKDSDDTSLVFEVLTRFGHDIDIEAVLDFEEDAYFRCFALEANPSISANIHVLSALRHAGLGLDHPAVSKTMRFLERSQTLRLFWFDKWHASPYYPTTHAIIACAGYRDDLVQDTVYWLVTTQNRDGSWGYYAPTAEETAYCLQALYTWKKSGKQVPADVLQRGIEWLSAHGEPPYAPLWIGKCLYSPELVIRSAVLSALALAAQDK